MKNSNFITSRGELKLKFNLKLIYDERSVGQSVSVSGSHLEFCFMFDNSGILAVERPLWREDWSVIYLYNCFWALREQSLWGPSPAELRPYSTVSFESPSTWRARSPYLYAPGTGRPSYTPGHWVSFCLFLRLAWLRWRYSNPPPHGSELFKIIYENSECTSQERPIGWYCLGIIAVYYDNHTKDTITFCNLSADF
jgi:hypothetical protein